MVDAARNAVADAGIDKWMLDGVLVKMANFVPSILYGACCKTQNGIRGERNLWGYRVRCVCQPCAVCLS